MEELIYDWNFTFVFYSLPGVSLLPGFWQILGWKWIIWFYIHILSSFVDLLQKGIHVFHPINQYSAVFGKNSLLFRLSSWNQVWNNSSYKLYYLSYLESFFFIFQTTTAAKIFLKKSNCKAKWLTRGGKCKTRIRQCFVDQVHSNPTPKSNST